MEYRQNPQRTPVAYREEDDLEPIDSGYDRRGASGAGPDGPEYEPAPARSPSRGAPAPAPAPAPSGGATGWAAGGYDYPPTDGHSSAEALRARRAEALQGRAVLEGRLRKAMFGGLALGGVLVVLRLAGAVFGGSPTPPARPSPTATPPPGTGRGRRSGSA